MLHFLIIVTINHPWRMLNSKPSRNDDHIQAYKSLHSDNGEGDLLYFEVYTDNEEFCGQKAIPLSSLRTGQLFSSFYYNRKETKYFLFLKIHLIVLLRLGIRSVALHDKFNEHLVMSALLVDIQLKAGMLFSFFLIYFNRTIIYKLYF